MAAKNSSAKQGPQAKALTEVKALARILRQYDLSELEVETEGTRISLKRQPTRSLAATVTAASETESPATTHRPAESKHADSGAVDTGQVSSAELVTSPLVGTFYSAPSPDSASFVEVGQAVRKGQTLCIIEAMKLMNEIEAESDGRVLEILVANSQAVEYGQPLFRLEANQL